MRFVLAVLAALLLPAAARAADTVLTLSETAHVAVRPDLLVAALRAEAAAPGAAAAQSRVNAAVAQALEAAKGVPGITVSTGVYNVWHRTQPTDQWTAVQTVELKGGDGAAMLALVGRLQGQSLAVDRLSWQLRPETARKAEAEATRQALAALRGRAEEAARILGLRFSHFRAIRIGAERPAIPVLTRGAMALGADVAVPPQAAGQEADITATVEAEAVLTPP